MSHRPRKRFGQNFLHDPSVIDRILSFVDASAGQRVVEIGPGQGALTCGLLRQAQSMDAIELDRDLIDPLRRMTERFGELRLHNADALKFDFRALAGDGGKLRVVGNLPYNISTPLLFHLIDQSDVIDDMHFMLQKEVVDRMAAPPGSKAYGRLSVMLQVTCDVTALFDIGPESFHPPPNVRSSVVCLRPLAKPIVTPGQIPTFARFIARVFRHRRKTLRNNLMGLLDAHAIANCGVDPSARSETLPIGDLMRLFDAARGRSEKTFVV